MEKVIIIGSGPAGLGASVYLSRYKVEHLIIGSQAGGYINNTDLIQNYLGFSEIKGFELATKMKSHVENLGAKIIEEEVKTIKKEQDYFSVETNRGNKFESQYIIYAIGTKHRSLGIPGEEELEGKGVSYCATCDGPFFKDKNVVVVGGGNSAGSAAQILAQHAKAVTVIYRKKEPPMLPSYLDEIKRNPKITLICCTNLKEIKGKEKVEEIILDVEHQGSDRLKTDGVFIEIGSVPRTQLIKDLKVDLNDWGFIKTQADQSTSLDKFYAVGDVTTGSNGFRQIICAVSEGAIAALAIFEKMKEK